MKEDDKMTTLMKDGKEVVALAAGGVEFYPIDDNADQINVQGKTWYAIDGSGDQINAQGKKWYPIPTKVTIPNDTLIGDLNDGDWYETNGEATVSISGFIANYPYHGDVYFFPDTVQRFQGSTSGGIVQVSKCTNVVWQ